MRVELNSIFRAVQQKHLPNEIEFDENGYNNIHFLTSHAGKMTSINIQRPMFANKPVKHDGETITPALYFHSNPYKTNRKVKPWTDILMPDQGLVYYNGDNQTPGLPPSGKQNGKTGNRIMEELWDLYASLDIDDRRRAPPILIFEQVKCMGTTKGYRKFIGYGIVTKTEIRQEYLPRKKNNDSVSKVFSNYLFEITLLKTDDDNKIDWDWIKDRRDPAIPKENINNKAPKAWKKWVKNGSSILSESMQKIRYYDVSTKDEQVSELENHHILILDKIKDKYDKSKEKGRFEALASLAASVYFGDEKYTRGWITKLSGDMGVDFIGRLKIYNEAIPNPKGTVLGQTSILVLGQAKCRTDYKRAYENATDIARVASRLKRGNMGIFVTTGTYSPATQHEVILDGYPIILINGRQLADLINAYSIKTGKTIDDILQECDKYYDSNQSDKPPEHILRD